MLQAAGEFFRSGGVGLLTWVGAGAYVVLAAAQMLASAGLVSLITSLLCPPGGWEIAIKAVVDIVLFFISFQIQREFVYKKKA